MSEMNTVHAFLKECGAFFVATVKEGGVPALRPFGAVMEYQGSLFFSTGASKAVYRQLAENPHMEIAALKPGTREWIRISGLARECTDPVIKGEMLRQCPALTKHFDTPGNREFALFELTEMQALLCTDAGTSRLA